MKRITVAFVYFFIFLFGATQALAARPCHGSKVDGRDYHQDELLDKQKGKIAKSDNDRSLYRYLKLDNEMQVLLVSDQTADQSSLGKIFRRCGRSIAV